MLESKVQILLSSKPVNRLASLNRHTGTPAHRQTILVLCFLCLYSVVFAEEQFVYDSKNKRDPFISLITPDGRLLKLEQEEGAGALLLEGIIYDKYGLSYAIVNGEIMRIGDKVGDYQVLKIEENKVIFIKDGEPLELELKREEP